MHKNNEIKIIAYIVSNILVVKVHRAINKHNNKSKANLGLVRSLI